MATVPFQQLNVSQVAEQLCDRTWTLVESWPNFAKDTIGKQLVRSADSIGAKIAEGNGRGTANDHRRFVRIARGSFNETRHWLRRAFVCKLLKPEDSTELQALLDRPGLLINGLLRSIERTRHSPETQPAKPTRHSPET